MNSEEAEDKRINSSLFVLVGRHESPLFAGFTPSFEMLLALNAGLRVCQVLVVSSGAFEH